MARFNLDPNNPPKLSGTQRRRLDAMTEADIAAGAEADSDNPPLTEAELAKLRTARAVRQARRHAGLSQAAFARTYRINLARLRDLEQGRTVVGVSDGDREGSGCRATRAEGVRVADCVAPIE